MTEIPIQQDRLKRIKTDHSLELTGRGADAIVYRVTQVRDGARVATGKVLKTIQPKEADGLSYEDKIRQLLLQALEMRRQRALLTHHFSQGQEFSQKPLLTNVIPQIDPPFISDLNEEPHLCVFQEDLDPNAPPHRDSTTMLDERELRSVYSLTAREVRARPQILLELNIFVSRVRALMASGLLAPDEDLMLVPKNFSLSHRGEIALPDLFPIERAGDPANTSRLDSSVGIAVIEKRMLKRPISPRDPFYEDLFQFMQEEGLETPEEAFTAHYAPWLRH